MGRHTATGPQMDRAVELWTVGLAPRATPKKPLVPAEFRPIVIAVSALLALIVVIIAIALSGHGSSNSSSSSSSSSSTVPYWQSQPPESWWIDAKGEFTQRFAYYERLSGRTYMPNQYQLGMEWCRAMRAGQTGAITGMVSNDPVPGQIIWATVNTAIDIYCPDQEGYRNLIASP